MYASLYLQAARRLMLIVSLLLALPSFSQTYFNERYTNQGSQSYLSAILATDSGYVGAGQAFNYPYANHMALMLRFLNPQGQQVRVRYYGQAGYSYFGPAAGSGFFQLPDGGYALVGTQNQPAAQVGMLWRFNAQGDTLWTRTYAQATEVVIYGGARLADGGYALVGQQPRLPPARGAQMLIIRTDSLGQQRWVQRYGTAFISIAYHAEATADGGLLVSGFCYSGSFSAPYVVKVDSLGNRQWERRFGSLQDFNGPGGVARPLADGNYIVGATRSGGDINGYKQYQPIVYKLNPQGQILWQKAIGPARAGTELYQIHELADGSLVAAGMQADTTRSTPRGNGFPEGIVFKMCPDGDSLWYRSYQQLLGWQSHNYLRDLQPTSDGGFVGGGYLFSHPPDTGTNDAWAFRIDSAGYLQAGGAPVTVRCRPLGGVESALAAEALAVWPNPAPDGRFAVRLAQAATAVVVDARGRDVWHGALAAGQSEVDLRGQPPGLYLLRLTDERGRGRSVKLLR